MSAANQIGHLSHSAGSRKRKHAATPKTTDISKHDGVVSSGNDATVAPTTKSAKLAVAKLTKAAKPTKVKRTAKPQPISESVGETPAATSAVAVATSVAEVATVSAATSERKSSPAALSTVNDIPGVVYMPEALTKSEADNLFKVLMDSAPWGTMVNVVGRYRLQKWGKTSKSFNRMVWPYQSGVITQVDRFFIDVLQLDSFLNNLSRVHNFEIKGAFLNLYRTGSDFTGLHADKVTPLHSTLNAQYGADVISVSLGATRTFAFVHNTTGKRSTVSLNHSDALYFSLAVNNLYKHEIPKESHIKLCRINITIFGNSRT